MEHLTYLVNRLSGDTQPKRHAYKRVFWGLAALCMVLWLTIPGLADEIPGLADEFDAAVTEQYEELPPLDAPFDQSLAVPEQGSTRSVFPILRPTVVEVPQIDSRDGHLPRYYLKVGGLVPLGGGQHEDLLGSGWTVQVGYRDWLSPRADETGFFFDLGGGFTHNGRHSSGPVSPGVFHADGDDHDHMLDEFYETNLTEARRGFVQAALGRRYEPRCCFKPGHHRMQFTVRGGGRISHANLWVDNLPTEALQEVIDDHLGHGHDPDGLEFRSEVQEQYTETYTGVFGNIGIGVMYYDVSWRKWRLGDVALQAELEFSHDWVTLQGFDDDGLGGFAQMLTLSFLR